MLKIFAFYCVFTPVSTILGEMVAQRFTASYVEYIILAVTMATNMVSEFLYCRFFVYKNSMTKWEPPHSEEAVTKEEIDKIIEAVNRMERSETVQLFFE